MTQKTNITTIDQVEMQHDSTAVNKHLVQDVRTSILIISLLVNLVVLTSWIALQVTTQFDGQVFGVIFDR